jgi:hypothetical protein
MHFLNNKNTMISDQMTLQYLYYNIQKFVCLLVWQLIGLAPGHDRDLGSVSLEPVWPQVESREKNFADKWPVAKLAK